jgi:hypothetical protein
MNIAIMKKAHEDAIIEYNGTRQYIWATPAMPVHGAKEVLAHLRPQMAKYFVLTMQEEASCFIQTLSEWPWCAMQRDARRGLCRVWSGKAQCHGQAISFPASFVTTTIRNPQLAVCGPPVSRTTSLTAHPSRTTSLTAHPVGEGPPYSSPQGEMG